MNDIFGLFDLIRDKFSHKSELEINQKALLKEINECRKIKVYVLKEK